MAQNENKEATLLSVAIEEFGKKFSPVETEEKKTRATISTDFVVSQLDGIADFERQEVAEELHLHGYHVGYADDDLAWIAWQV